MHHRRNAVALALLAVLSATVHAQDKTLTIGTGFESGVYFPLGKGIATLVAKHVPGYAAKVEATGGSVDNLRLLSANRIDVGFSMADASWDAYTGVEKFKAGKLNVRALLVMYPNSLHVVTLDRSDIRKMADLKGRTVATGAPGSATEIMAQRLFEAYRMEKDFKRERLSLEDSVSALKEARVDAFLWSGGVPTAAIAGMAAAGYKIRLIDHDDAVDEMVKKYGPLYTRQAIAPNAYAGVSRPTRVAGVWNILVVGDTMPTALAYSLVKAILENQPDMVAAHMEGENIALQAQSSANSPIPFHPGAIKYFAEKGIKLK